ncbi:hypothetical protein D3C87_2039560 [compost metagenome]
MPTNFVLFACKSFGAIWMPLLTSKVAADTITSLFCLLAISVEVIWLFINSPDASPDGLVVMVLLLFFGIAAKASSPLA